ncbi:MAG: hypothetical protein DBY23_03945 [Bacillota bacterium]|nr:MAG: hypothetical protein DBY23_03945 [Bacillota bacterium]
MGSDGVPWSKIVRKTRTRSEIEALFLGWYIKPLNIEKLAESNAEVLAKNIDRIQRRGAQQGFVLCYQPREIRGHSPKRQVGTAIVLTIPVPAFVRYSMP